MYGLIKILLLLCNHNYIYHIYLKHETSRETIISHVFVPKTVYFLIFILYSAKIICWAKDTVGS